MDKEDNYIVTITDDYALGREKLLPTEWLDVLKIDGGNGKHEPGSWAKPDGATMSHKYTHNSMFHHLAESYCHNRIDEGTQLDHLLSIAFRALALYTRLQRGIKHPDDE